MAISKKMMEIVKKAISKIAPSSVPTFRGAGSPAPTPSPAPAAPNPVEGLYYESPEYKAYLARINAPTPDPVYAAPVPTPTPGFAPTPFPPTLQPQPPQQQPFDPNYVPPVYGQPGAGNANFIRDSYGVRPGMAEPGVYFGEYDLALFDRIRQQALAGARPPVPMAQGGDVLLNFLKKNRML